MAARSFRKAVELGIDSVVQAAVKTKGNLERLTVIAVVKAAGCSFKPIIVYPGKQPHYRRVNGKVETLHNYLPDCYFYQGESPGVESKIFFDWAKQFCIETRHLRLGGKKMFLLLDGYSCHIRVDTLQHLQDNDVYVVSIPAHTSHVLQPLHVTVFGLFKSFSSVKSVPVQQESLSWAHLMLLMSCVLPCQTR